MSEEIKAIASPNTGVIGKVLIAFIVLFGLFIGAFAWQNIQADKTLSELIKLNVNIQNMIEAQDQIKDLKIDIKESYDVSMDEFNNVLLDIIGKTFDDNQVPFPQTLNNSIKNFRIKMEEIKNCLIMP